MYYNVFIRMKGGFFVKIRELIYHERIGHGHYASVGTVTREGNILVTAGGNAPFTMISRNRGASFQIRKGINYPTDYGFTQLFDGTFISFGSDNVGHSAFMDHRQKKLQFILKIISAKSFDDILDCRIDISFAIVDIRDLTFGYGYSNNCHSGAVAQGCVELENGDIIVTMYGQRTTDTTLCPYFVEQGYNFYLYSTWCIISHDGGKSFEYLSFIADVQTYPIPDVNAEGYCETNIFAFGGGHIAAFCVLAGMRYIHRCMLHIPMTTEKRGECRMKSTVGEFCRNCSDCPTAGWCLFRGICTPFLCFRRMRV